MNFEDLDINKMLNESLAENAKTDFSLRMLLEAPRVYALLNLFELYKERKK